MTRLSLALAFLAASKTFVAAQQSAVAALVPDNEDECTGCYLLADVAAIAFGEVQTVIDTQPITVGRPLNGSTEVTRTGSVRSGTVTLNQGQFSYNPAESTAPPQAPINFNDYDSTINFGGAVLTSPTRYEVFTAYSITSFVKRGDSCATVSNPAISLTSAYSYIVSEDADDAFLVGLQSSFIQQVGLTCSAGGGNVQSIVQSMVARSTEQVTTTQRARLTPIAASLPGRTSNPTAPLTTAPTSIETSSTTVVFGNATGGGGIATGSGVGPTYAPIAPGAASGLEVRWIMAVVAAVGLTAVLL